MVSPSLIDTKTLKGEELCLFCDLVGWLLKYSPHKVWLAVLLWKIKVTISKTKVLSFYKSLGLPLLPFFIKHTTTKFPILSVGPTQWKHFIKTVIGKVINEALVLVQKISKYLFLFLQNVKSFKYDFLDDAQRMAKNIKLFKNIL